MKFPVINVSLCVFRLSFYRIAIKYLQPPLFALALCFLCSGCDPISSSKVRRAEESARRAKLDAEVALNDANKQAAAAQQQLESLRKADVEHETPDTSKITLVAWNVESGGSSPETIASQLPSLVDGADFYGLTEVLPSAFETFTAAIDAIDDRDFKSINGSTGRDDRLQIIYDSTRFELLKSRDLDEYLEWRLNDGNHRSPLVARFKERQSGLELRIVLHHGARGKEDVRNQQAIGLREMGRGDQSSTIFMGDFNFDYDFKTKQGNESFTELNRDGVLTWVKPLQMIDSNWADRNGDGVDDYPDSMLDGFFVAGRAKEWTSTCVVLQREGDFPDTKETSDHRPVVCVVAPK